MPFPDRTDWTILVTGATGGIGLQAAKEIAGTGARTMVLARNGLKAKETVQEVRRYSGNDRVESVACDLSVQSEIRRAADEIASRVGALDALVNNAGVIQNGFRETKDGIETTFAVNHLGYFLLTDLLMDTLKAAPRSRIVSVASRAHYNANLSLDDVEMRRGYQGWTQYCNTKLMNILWTRELARRLAGTNVTANCLHPGFVKTELARRSPFLDPMFKTFGNSVEKGADTAVWLAVGDEVDGRSGEYFSKRKPGSLAAKARDDALGQRLLEISEGYVR